MIRIIFVVIVAVCIVMPLKASEPIANPTNNPVIGFINKEKFRTSVEEVVDRYLHPEKYQDNGNKELPELLSNSENTAISTRAVPESEVHAAISPVNPDIMVVSPIRQDASNPNASVTCPVYYSKDRGKSWSVSSFISKPFSKPVLLAGGGDPVFVFDAVGDLYFSWINIYLTMKASTPDSIFAALFWAKSTNGGETFTFDESNYVGEKLFASKYTEGISGMIDKQWMTADFSNSAYRNSVYTSGLYISLSGQSQTMQMHVYHKRSGAKQFERKPSIINTSQFSTIQFGSLDTDSKGYVHLTFYAIQNNVQALYHSYSTNGGVNFSNPTKISNIIGSMREMSYTENVPGISQQRMYPAPYMVVDKSVGLNKDNIYIAWSASGTNSRGTKGMDIYFSRSTNNGVNWSTPKPINDDDLTGIHNFYSNIAVNNKGIIAVTWYDTRNFTANQSQAFTDYFIGLSFDGGLTFENHKVSSQPSNFRNIGGLNSNFGIGEYNAIMMTDDYAYPVWGDGRTNNGNVNIYMAKVSLIKDEGSVGVVEDILPINENVKISTISPNPASNLIDVEFSSKFNSDIELEITDITGRKLITTGKLQISTGENLRQIDVSYLPSGNYFVRIIAGDSYSVKLFNVVR